MAILGRRGSSLGRVRRQAAPVAQQQQRAVAAQTKAPVAQRTGIAPAPAQKMPGNGLPVAPNSAAQAAAVKQFNQSQQGAVQQFNAPTAALQAAQQRSNPNMSIPMGTMPSAPAAQTPSKAMQSYMAAEKAGTAGNMAKPAFRKGGAVKKKTGYAKGGAVLCGASVPPAQKGKK